jgi:hypothetical protein
MDYEQRTGKRVFVNSTDMGLRVVDEIAGLRVGVSAAVPPDTIYVVDFDALLDRDGDFLLGQIRFER